MFRVVLMLEVGETLLEREIQMPFAPCPGLDLMLGESAWWNQMTFDSVMWYDELQEMQCNVSLHDLFMRVQGASNLSDAEVVEVLLKNKWTLA